MSQFTLLELEDLYDFKSLLNSLKSTIKNEIIKNGENEIELIGFDYLTKLYLNDNFDEKEKKKNGGQDMNLIKNIRETNIHNNKNIDRKLMNESLNQNNISNRDNSKINVINIKNGLNQSKEKNINEKGDEIKNIEDKKLSLNKENKNIEINKIISITPEKPKEINDKNKNSSEKRGKIIDIRKIVPKNLKYELKIKENINENKCPSNNINIKNQLMKNLHQQTVGSYFVSQKLKYIRIYKNNSEIQDNISRMSIGYLIFKFNQNKLKYWNINKALIEIDNLFSSNNINRIIKPEYGFFVLEKQILFYTQISSKEENEILFNSEYLRQLDYDYAATKESSYKTISNIGDDKNKIDYFWIKGLDFENNWEFFFDYYFNLKKLANIFLPLYTKLDNKYSIELNEPNSNKFDNKTTEKEGITFKYYIDNYNPSFIEVDFARINNSNYYIEPNFIYKPFINEPAIMVYKKNNIWKSKIQYTNEFKIYPKSIVLGEIKNSVPEKITIINNDDIIDKNILRSLYFVLYNLIRKINYYIQYVKYEVLNDDNEIKNYQIQLFLIYNNKPINNMNFYIKECIDNLIKKNYINNDFIFQIVYSSPSINSLNLYNLTKDILSLKNSDEEKSKMINEQNEKISNQNDKINILNFELNEIKKKLESLEKNNNSNK